MLPTQHAARADRMKRLPTLTQAYVLITAADLAGLIVASTTGLSNFRHALLSGTAINAPIPFLVGQLAIATAAVQWQNHRSGRLAAAVLAVVGTLSVLSGFADGSYTTTLTTTDRAIQLT